MQSTTERWFSLRGSEYFCDDCNEQLVAHFVRESFVSKAPLDEIVYTCNSCGRSVIIPATPMFSS
jgi:RNase P subunit RPR2